VGVEMETEEPEFERERCDGAKYPWRIRPKRKPRSNSWPNKSTQHIINR